MSAHLEVERAFSPGAETPLPDLTALETVRSVEAAGEDELDATYFDVPGLTLLRAGVTLRRRTGGADEGWHLKLPGPAPSSRLELHDDLGPAGSGPPDRLLELVAGWCRGIAPAPVARIRTLRRTSRLVGADGVVLAELADDRVEGRAAQLGGAPARWREWEVELRHGDLGLLDDVETLLAEVGVRRSEVQHKLGVVLQVDDPAREAGSGTAGGPVRKKAPAGRLLHHWVTERVEELSLLDPLVREGEPGGVHGMRKACRRLRAALATCRPLVARDETDPLRGELGWLARGLGSARDDEVVLARIDALLEAEPPESDPESARRTLERHAATRAVQDRAETLALLGSQRYFELRAALDALVSRPTWTPAADEPARDVLPRLVRKEAKRVRRHRDAEDPHELRKALKRLRYAYELVEPAWGKAAARPRKAARELTRVLGDRQDTVVTREWLVALSAEAARAGESAFAFGRLHALEETRATDLLAQVAPLWSELESTGW